MKRRCYVDGEKLKIDSSDIIASDIDEMQGSMCMLSVVFKEHSAIVHLQAPRQVYSSSRHGCE